MSILVFLGLCYITNMPIGIKSGNQSPNCRANCFLGNAAIYLNVKISEFGVVIICVLFKRKPEMKKKSRLMGLFSIVTLAMIAGFSLPLTGAVDSGEVQKKIAIAIAAKGKQDSPAVVIGRVHGEAIPATLKTIDKVMAAINAGDNKTALSELIKARKTLVAIHKDLGKLVSPRFINAYCPIMGSPINPNKITKKLTRTYKGQQVALCCGGCIGPWDKLTDAQKEAKLKAAEAKQEPAGSDDGHSQHKH